MLIIEFSLCTKTNKTMGKRKEIERYLPLKINND